MYNTTILQYTCASTCMRVSVPLCVSLHSPRCSIRCIGTCFLKSDSTACISYVMWNRVPYSHGCSEPIVIFLSPSLWHMTTLLNSSPGAIKLGPVGPAWLKVLLSRQSSALLWTDFSPLSYCCISMF